jgi:ribosomal protein S12 methylthiotransferase accessory factor
MAVGMESLVSPYGLVGQVARLAVSDGELRFPVVTASVGDLGEVLDAQVGFAHDAGMGNIDGAGGDIDPQRAAFLAIAESLERYSSCAWRPDRMIWATARELGDDAVDLAQWPACSERELADPACTLLGPDPDGPMRWVLGWSLTRRRPIYVPAILAWLKNAPQSRAERFTHMVSTGCATHTDPLAAVLGGLLEVVERDAITLAWLHRLRLPRLEPAPGELTGRYLTATQRATVPHLRTELFDATTDLGIPVVYGLQLADHDPHLAQLVSATCDPAEPGRAVAKLYREAASVRVALRSMLAHGTRDYAADKVSVVGGALAMGPSHRRDRFDFLLEGPRPVHRLADLPRPPASAVPEVLAWALRRVHRAGCEVIVVDLTTDEAAQVGAVVVHVLVPQLMPLSFDPHARFLAHPRLLRAPAAMGHPVCAEEDLNTDPQPFA